MNSFSRFLPLATCLQIILTLIVLEVQGANAACAAAPEYQTQVQPLLRKYCGGCHNDSDHQGGLSLATHALALRGGDSGAQIVPGDAAASRLYRLAAGLDEPTMPPEGAAMGPAELAILKNWIDGGALAPTLALIDRPVVPRIAIQTQTQQPVVGIALSSDGQWRAVARPQGVAIFHEPSGKELPGIPGLSGTVNRIGFSADSQRLFVVGGETGVSGAGLVYGVAPGNPPTWSEIQELAGHRDAIYSAAFSPDAERLVTASYDQQLIVWETATGAQLARLSGHNDAVYDVAFCPTQNVVASASGDRTVKLWNPTDGKRLDTLSQPAKEQYAVAFHPSGQIVAASGCDNRVRVWKLAPDAKEGANLLEYSRFAHEAPVMRLAYSPDGSLLATASEDRWIKFWETTSYTEVAMLPRQVDWPSAIAFSANGTTLHVGLMNGDVARYAVSAEWKHATSASQPLTDAEELSPRVRKEPGVTRTEAKSSGPAISAVLEKGVPVKGLLAQPGARQVYSFTAKQGETRIFETNAARSGSKADTRIEVLSETGDRMPRALVQAVRDSWITFRGVNSTEFMVRVEYWQEMDLNQYLFMNGEIVKLEKAPRGPDSGFDMYASKGKRRTFFDTTATAHAKEEPVYIVSVYPADAQLLSNGLPVFTLYYENGDDSENKLGTDSRLTFVAPADGTYLVRVSDERGFGGENFTYELVSRAPQPDFSVSVDTKDVKVPAGTGQRLLFTLERTDGFNEEVELHVAGLPAGWSATERMVFERGHLRAVGTLIAADDAAEPTTEQLATVQVIARTVLNGTPIERPVGGLGTLKREAPPQVKAYLELDAGSPRSAEGILQVEAGTTVPAKIRIERNGYAGNVQFEVEGLPHGVIVDNIGLSGVLVRENETERQIFLTAPNWVPESTRWISAVANTAGASSSPPIKVQVVPRKQLAAKLP